MLYFIDGYMLQEGLFSCKELINLENKGYRVNIRQNKRRSEGHFGIYIGEPEIFIATLYYEGIELETFYNKNLYKKDNENGIIDEIVDFVNKIN